MSIGREMASWPRVVTGLALALLFLASFACERSSHGPSDRANESAVVERQLGPYRLGDSLKVEGACRQYHEDRSCLAQDLGGHYYVATLDGKIVRVQETFPSGSTEVLRDISFEPMAGTMSRGPASVWSSGNGSWRA